MQIVTKGRQTVIAMLDLAIRIDHWPIALAFNRNFPPDEHWRGTKPSQADRWRSFLNSLASPTAATIAVAVMGPMPSIAEIFLHGPSVSMNALIQPSARLTRSCNS